MAALSSKLIIFMISCGRHMAHCFFVLWYPIVNFLKKTDPFNLFCPQKVIRFLADIAKHICQISIRSDGILFPKRANEHLFVRGASN